MSWSCRVEVSRALDRLSDWCRACSGMSNVIAIRGKDRLIELSRREWDDGSATGTIRTRVPSPPGAAPDAIYYSARGDSFRIGPNGRLVYGPHWLDVMLADPATADFCGDRLLARRAS